MSRLACRIPTVNAVVALAAVTLTLVLTHSAGADQDHPTLRGAASVAPAPAPVLSPPMPRGCSTLVSQREFATVAHAVYRGAERPSPRARRLLGRMAHCQYSPRATRDARALQRRLDAAQRARTCSDDNVVACIRFAASWWHVSFRLMLSRAVCESSLNRLASDGVHFGLYQFLPSTWADETSYGAHSYWSPKWNALGAAEMQARGEGGQWECEG